MKEILLFRLYIMALLLYSFSSEYTPVKVSPYEYYNFYLSNPTDLTLNQYYAVYSFSNDIPEDKKTDLVLQFKIGKGYSTKVAIYNQQENINQDAAGNFKDSVLAYESVGKEIVIGSQDQKYIGKGTYFIILYDLTFFYRDSMRIFNEGTSIELKKFDCYEVPRLYSLGSLAFHVINAKYEYMDFSIASKSPKAPVLEIRENSLEGPVIREIETAGFAEYIKVNPNSNGIYLKFYKREGEEYDEEFQTTFCISLFQEVIHALTHSYAPKRYAFGTHFYFFFDLSNYGPNDEGDALLEFDYSPVDSFEGLYCKYIESADRSDEEALMKQYPTKEEENECAIQKDDLIDTAYHLFYKKAVKDIKALLVYVKVKGKHYGGLSFRLILSQPMVTIDTDQLLSDNDVTVPRYYKIDPNTIYLNLIVAVSKANVMSVFYGSLSEGKVATKPTYLSQIFATNQKKKEVTEPLPVIYIRLYGGTEVVNIEAYFTPLDIIYIGGNERPKSQFQVEINKCFNYYYLIGSYVNSSRDFLSVETVYGKESVFHRGTYNPNKRIENNFPIDGSSADLMKGTVVATSNVDFMKITCAYSSIPTSMLISFTPTLASGSALRSGDSFKTTLTNEQIIEYDVASSSISSETLGIEARIESDDSVVEVLVNNVKVATLNHESRLYRDQLTNNGLNDNKFALAFKSTSAKMSILNVQVGSNQLYHKMTDTGASNSQYTLITLKPVTSYYSATIKFKLKDLGFNYCLSQGFSEAIFLALPKNNCQPVLAVNTVKVSNPYDKFIDKSITSSEVYYIAIALDKKPPNGFAVDIVYEAKEYAKQIFEQTQIYVDTDTTGVRTIKSNDMAKDIIVFNLIPCANQKISYQLYFNREEKSELIDTIEPIMHPMENSLTEIDLKLYSKGGLVSYRYLTQKEYDAHVDATIKKYAIETKTADDTITVKFYPLVKGRTVVYQLYALKTGDKQKLNDNCAVFSMRPDESITMLKDDESLIEKTIKVKEIGTYQVNVLAESVNGWEITQLYASTEVIVNNIPDPDPKPDPPDPKPEPDPEPEPEPKDPSKPNFSWLWITLGCFGGVIFISIISFAIIKVIKARNALSAESAEPFDNILIA